MYQVDEKLYKMKMREKSIDICKCIAIFAVLMDHTNGILYGNHYILCASYFSVSLFIMLMGITCYWSFGQSKRSIGEQTVSRIVRMLVSYAIAVAVYYCVEYKNFSFIEYRNFLFNFNISGPLYYVLLYIQLLLIAPVIYYLLRVNDNRKHEHIIEAILGGV